MHLVIVRHGRTEANAHGLLLGRLDVELDPVGRAQAERLAAATGPVDRVIASPLQRTRQTAAAFDQRRIGIVVPRWRVVLDQIELGEPHDRPRMDAGEHARHLPIPEGVLVRVEACADAPALHHAHGG